MNALKSNRLVTNWCKTPSPFSAVVNAEMLGGLFKEEAVTQISRWVKLTVFNLLRFTPEKDLAFGTGWQKH